MAAPPTAAPYGSCRFCGVATPPDATACPICGIEAPIAAPTTAAAPSVRRRVRWTHALRVLLVVGVAAGLAYTIVDAEITGPPVVADPLTTAGVHSIPIGSIFTLAGNITGGDYVVGNFTTIDPSGLSLGVVVYNSSEWGKFVNGSAATPAWSLPAADEGRIIFSAPYTDFYHFVFENPYPASSGFVVTAYITTEYESNVGDDGFG